MAAHDTQDYIATGVPFFWLWLLKTLQLGRTTCPLRPAWISNTTFCMASCKDTSTQSCCCRRPLAKSCCLQCWAKASCPPVLTRTPWSASQGIQLWRKTCGGHRHPRVIPTYFLRHVQLKLRLRPTIQHQSWTWHLQRESATASPANVSQVCCDCKAGQWCCCRCPEGDAARPGCGHAQTHLQDARKCVFCG